MNVRYTFQHLQQLVQKSIQMDIWTFQPTLLTGTKIIKNIVRQNYKGLKIFKMIYHVTPPPLFLLKVAKNYSYPQNHPCHEF